MMTGAAAGGQVAFQPGGTTTAAHTQQMVGAAGYGQPQSADAAAGGQPQLAGAPTGSQPMPAGAGAGDHPRPAGAAASGHPGQANGGLAGVQGGEAHGPVPNPVMQINVQTTTGKATSSTIDNQLVNTVPPILNPAHAMLDVPESSHKGGNHKSKGKPYCYRCHTKGHTMSVCTTVLCCDLCFGDHVKKVCPNLKNLNSTAIPCGYAVEGLGFYFIPVAENPKLTSEDKSAVVRVLEGSLTADQLAVELDKLLPVNSWVISEKGTDAFITNFPTSEVLNHMVNWGPMDTKTVKGKIRFEKGVEIEVYKYEIYKVWVQFRAFQKNFESSLLFGQLAQFWEFLVRWI